MASNPDTHAVNLFLNGGRVTSGFRSALFDAAARTGMSVNELCIRATAEMLAQTGAHFPGIFRPGDFPADREAA